MKVGEQGEDVVEGEILERENVEAVAEDVEFNVLQEVRGWGGIWRSGPVYTNKVSELAEFKGGVYGQMNGL